MTDNKKDNDNAIAMAAIGLFANEPKGSPPEWHEIHAWREGQLSAERSAEVLSHVANNPDIFQQWLDLADAESWVDDEQTTAANESSLNSAASNTPTSLWQGAKSWLASLIKLPLPVYGGAIAAILMAVITVPLMQTGNINPQQQLDESMMSFPDLENALPGAHAQLATRSLENIFDELSNTDVERHQFQFGLRRFSDALTASRKAPWTDWITSLPSEPVDCGKAIDGEFCKTSAPALAALGQWTMLNYAACNTSSAKSIANDDVFWAGQSNLFNQLREQLGATQSTLFSPSLDKLDANTSVAICLRMESLMTAGQ